MGKCFQFFTAIIISTTLCSIPSYAAETLVCNNWFPDSTFKKSTSPTGARVVTTSAILDVEKNKIIKVTYIVKLFVDGEVTVKVKDAAETEVITLDKRKFVSWTVDHQPYHILMEDAVLNYMKLK